MPEETVIPAAPATTATLIPPGSSPTPAPAAPAPPAPAYQAPAPPAVPAAPPAVSHTPDEWRAIQDRLARLDQIEIQAEKDRLEAQKREFAALTKAGETQKALELLERQGQENLARIQGESNARIAAEQRRFNEAQEAAARERTERESAMRATEQRAQRYALDGELSRALAGHNLVEGAAEELTQILRPQLAAQPEGESFVVRSATGQTAADLVSGYLQRRPHHLRAQNPNGGTATPGQTTQTPAAPATHVPPTPTERPKNLGEAYIFQFRDDLARRGTTSDATTDMTQQFGLGPAKTG